MSPVKLNDKWAINVFTKEFGEVIMLKEKELIPLTFDTKDETVEFIQSIREKNTEVVNTMKKSWKGHRHHLENIGILYDKDETHFMDLEDVEQVEWLIGHIESLNGHINSLIGETKDLEKEIENDSKYNQSFLKLLRTQSCIADVIDLINKRFEVEKQGEKFKW